MFPFFPHSNFLLTQLDLATFQLAAVWLSLVTGLSFEKKKKDTFSAHVMLIGSFLYFFLYTWELKEGEGDGFSSIHTFIQIKCKIWSSMSLTVSTGANIGQQVQSQFMAPQVQSSKFSWIHIVSQLDAPQVSVNMQSLARTKTGLLCSPPALDLWLVSHFTVREAVVCTVKVTAAWYLWGFPARWCPWRRERQNGYFLCLLQWWSGGRAASPGFSSYG